MDIVADLSERRKKVSVMGLGYVGLPLALEFAKHFDVIGFDINENKIASFQEGSDPSGELEDECFTGKKILFTSDEEALRGAHFHIIAVPTPIDEHFVPDLNHLFHASEILGRVLKRGDFVVYESTVYPGCTEEDCLPILERVSGLKNELDFQLGYSPERINPGDKSRTIDKILKVVAGSNDKNVEVIRQIYSRVITAGVYVAPTIKVAEAAKIIENTQRHINIALINELSVIFDKMNIDTRAVLDTAATKWNFLKFTPGLVGGHCIGVDPHYLIYKSRKIGFEPRIITSGCSVNDGMPAYIASKLVKTLIKRGKTPQESRVLVMGITFKENVSDVRNSKVADLVKELQQFSVDVAVVDPFAKEIDVQTEYQISLIDKPEGKYDAIVLAVQHRPYLKLEADFFENFLNKNAIVFDLKGIYDKDYFGENVIYWRM
jgi:UDP-N-acetyl-D-glucosamine/UDP-N-acetyl-D-galactosamine dehydrogenase